MNKLKQLLVVPLCLLTACAPPRPAGEVPPNARSTQQNTTSVSNAESSSNAAPQNKAMTVEQRKAKTQTISSWNIRGALAAKNKNKGWSASMNWVQQGPENYQIRLMGPLGSGAVLINKSGNTITFQDGAKKITSSSADELLAKQTGIRLPVSNLYYWIRGLLY